MKLLFLAMVLWVPLAFAERLVEEEKLQELGKRWEEADEKLRELSGYADTTSTEELVKIHNDRYRQGTEVDLAAANYIHAAAKFLMNYNYLPDIPRRNEFVGTYGDGSENYTSLLTKLMVSKIYCSRATLVSEEIKIDQKCPSKYRKYESRNRRLSKDFENWIIHNVESKLGPIRETVIAPSISVEDLGRGYKRRISGAGVLTIERAYPNSKNPKMILIGYECLDKLEKDTNVPLVFTYGDENNGLEFQIGREIPEDEVIKGRRILTLQILRFKKRAKEKPDLISNKELAAIADFTRQFDGKEISDQNNIILTEIYPDPDNNKQQIAASWRVPLDPDKPASELGYQAVQVIGDAK